MITKLELNKSRRKLTFADDCDPAPQEPIVAEEAVPNGTDAVKASVGGKHGMQRRRSGKASAAPVRVVDSPTKDLADTATAAAKAQIIPASQGALGRVTPCLAAAANEKQTGKK